MADHRLLFGFGAAIAEAALARGDNVMLTARYPAKLAAIADRYPGCAQHAALDVTDPASVKRAVAETESAFGQVDVFVNNAGFGVIGAVDEISPTEYRRMFETNVFGLIETTKVALPRHLRQPFVRLGDYHARRLRPLQR